MNGTSAPGLEFHIAPSRMHISYCMRRKSNLHTSGIEHDKLGAEQDVAKYIQLLSIVRLDSSEAICVYCQ